MQKETTHPDSELCEQKEESNTVSEKAHRDGFSSPGVLQESSTSLSQSLKLSLLLVLPNLAILFFFNTSQSWWSVNETQSNQTLALPVIQAVNNGLLLDGVLTSSKLLTVSSADDTKIMQLPASVGQRVRAGDLLVSFDTRGAEIDLRAALMDVELAAQKIEELENWSTNPVVLQARRELAAAKSKLDRSAINLEKTLSLHHSGIVSSEDLDIESAITQQDIDNHLSLKENLLLLLEEASATQISVTKAEHQNAIQAAELIKQELEDSIIYANFDGILVAAKNDFGDYIDRKFSVGELVAAYTNLFSLASTEHLYVQAYANEWELAMLSEGMETLITSPSFPDIHLRGVVSDISAIAMQNFNTDSETLTFAVGVKLNDLESKVRDMLPLNISVELAIETH